MPDSKITALTSTGTGTDPAVDPLVIVDVSDTTMAATGTTKKVTLNQLLACSPTATLASATITGDLTVSTNTLKTTSGNVGIGTVTPDIFSRFYTRTIGFNSSGSTVMQINGSSYSGIDLGAGGTRTFGIASSATDASLTTLTNIPIVFGINGSTAMTLNATGLGVGVSPQYKIHASQLVCASDPTQNGSAGRIYGAFLNAVGEPGLDLRRWDGGGGNNHGTTFIQTNVVGDTLFYNGLQASNTRATSLKMTLDASGNLLVNTTSQILSAKISLQTAGTRGYSYNDTTGGSGTKAIIFGSLGVEVGSVSTTTSATTYNTLSDYRLKEAVQPLVGGLARVSALKPSIYKWKSNGSSGEGFIAHELADVVPSAVTGEKDAVNEDGTVNPQGVDMSRIVPILVAAIQELTARVQTLETR